MEKRTLTSEEDFKRFKSEYLISPPPPQSYPCVIIWHVEGSPPSAAECIYAYMKDLATDNSIYISHILEWANMCERVFILPQSSWQFRYDYIFRVSKQQIGPALTKLNLKIDWLDPDTTYEEDVTAYMNGLRELVVQLRAMQEAGIA